MMARTFVAAVLAIGVVGLCAPPPAGAQAQPTASGRAVGYELEGAAIPEDQLAEVPARVQQALASCATDAAPLIGVSVRARIAIAPAGSVSSVTLEGAPATAQPARACVERALTTLTFPRRRAATTLILDLEFRRERGAREDPATARYRESVVEAMRRHQPAVHACFERATAAHEPHDDRVRVEFVIDAEGRLTRVGIPLGDEMPRLTECLTREMRGWTVPRPPAAPFEMTHRFEGMVASYE